MPLGTNRAWLVFLTAALVLLAGCATVEDPDQNESDAPPEAQPVDVDEIGADPAAVPEPLGPDAPDHHTFDLTVREVTAQMADGKTYEYWAYDDQVPGPMLRVGVNDTFTVNLHNHEDSAFTHDIDFHAVTGPGGGAPVLTADPGETATGTFQALQPGLYVYHCAVGRVADHVAHGMYGLVLVEPEGGMPEVDHEYYVMQGEFYSQWSASEDGHHELSWDNAMDEDPEWVVFNGRTGSLVDDDRRLRAQVGDTVRIYFGVGGPNLVSSFHVIGGIFDQVWTEGAIASSPAKSVQTTLVPAGGATVVDLTMSVPGEYKLVDHSLNRVSAGALGILEVTGEDQPDIYREGP